MALDNTLKRFNDAKQAIINSLNNNGIITDSNNGFESFSDKIQNLADDAGIIAQDSGWEYIILDDGTIQLTLYTGNDTSVVVPNRYIDNGICYRVSKVQSDVCEIHYHTTFDTYYSKGATCNVFSRIYSSEEAANTTVTSVEVAEGVDIGHAAFRNCTSLKSLILHKNIKNIHSRAFEKCSSLDGHLILPEGLLNIGVQAFNQTKFTELTLPESLQKYSHLPFSQPTDCCITKLNFNCKHLDTGLTLQKSNNPFGTKITSLSIGENVEIIPNRFLFNNENLTLDGNFLTKLTQLHQIGAESFKNVNITGDLIIPSSVYTIDAGAFANINCTGSLILNEGVVEIGESAFYGTPFSGGLTLPSTVKKIGATAFHPNVAGDKAYVRGNWSGDLILNEGLEWIGDYAFNKCQGFTNTTLTIPSTVQQLGGRTYTADNKVIGTHVFHDFATFTLSNVTVNNGSTAFCAVDGVLYAMNGDGDPKKLVLLPPAKRGDYVMPNTVSHGDELTTGFYGQATYDGYDGSGYNITLSDKFIVEVDEFTIPNNSTHRESNYLAKTIFRWSYIKNCYVNDTNPYYVSVNGLLLSKDGKRLYYIPRCNMDENREIHIPSTVERIEEGAVVKCRYEAATIYIPSSVTYIAPSAIQYFNYDPQDMDGVPKGAAIVVDEGNTHYAVNENGLLYAL